MNLTSFLLQVPVSEALTEPSEIRMSLWDMAVQGGWIMLVLAIFSVIAFYIFIERFITINKAAKKDDMFMETIRSYMKDGKLNDAKVLCQKASTPLSRMIEKGISRIGKPLNDHADAEELHGELQLSERRKRRGDPDVPVPGIPLVGEGGARPRQRDARLFGQTDGLFGAAVQGVHGHEVTAAGLFP